MAPIRRLLPALLLLLFVISDVATSSSSNDNCVYTVYVRTGSIIKGGTDSKISLTISDSSYRPGVHVKDLESWGLMPDGHDYYERGNLDIFSGRGRCLDGPICYLNLTSDGTGPHHGWYCEYVEVTATGPHLGCSQTIFYVRQWLALDAPPYRLDSIINGCAAAADSHAKRGRSTFYGENALGRDGVEASSSSS
ncbi:PLAT domain-containing protein 3-like [Nymphaea colorata]|nr:PLAT domain-containing protein 3-like [Nymphaea colorata]